MPLSAFRRPSSGPIGGLNRHEVVDDNDPRRLITVRRVQPTARRPAASRRGKGQRVLPATGAAPIVHSSLRMHSLAHAARPCLHRPSSTPTIAQRLKTIEAPRLHSRRFGSLWKNPGPNIERYGCDAGPRPRKCLVSTIAPAPRWVLAGLAALNLGPFRRRLSATRSLGSTSRYSLLRHEVAKPRRCRILEASQGWPYGRRSSQST